MTTLATAMANSACTRRAALGLLGVGVGVIAAGPGLAFAAAPKPVGVPVTAYFRDGLLHDPSGSLPPWRAPAGHRGAASLAALDAAALRNAGIAF